MRRAVVAGLMIGSGLAAYQWYADHAEKQRLIAARAETIRTCEAVIAREQRALRKDTRIGGALPQSVNAMLDIYAFVPQIDPQLNRWARQQAERNRQAMIEQESRRGRISHMQAYVRELRDGGVPRPGACRT